MKAKLATATLIGLLACSLGRAQTPAAAAADTSASATTPSAAAPAAPAPQPATTVSPASEPTAAAPATAAPVVTAPATTTLADATTTAPAAAAPASQTSAPATTAGDASAPLSPSAVIPLIQFQDVSLTTAIENLARQAGLNYILDPKVTFGQPGPNGQPAPQPNINLRWENLTSEQALMALLSTYSLQLVDDPKTKVARITLKDPAAPEPLITKIIQLKFAGPSNVLASVQSTFIDKRSKAVPDLRTSQLVVVATEKEQAAVLELIDRLDTPTKQVLIEGKILETTVNPTSVKGIDWSSTLTAQNVKMGNNALPGIGAQPAIPASAGPPPTLAVPANQGIIGGVLSGVGGGSGLLMSPSMGSFFQPATAFLNADGLNVALSFLNNSSDTKVISEPRMVTLDNQKATINVGLMFPIVNTTAGTANTTGGSSIAYSNLTVNLDVTPRITANEYVQLQIAQSILRLGPNVNSTVGGVQNIVPSFFTRQIETSVLIPSGNTLVMGGLISDESSTANTKVPLMGDIPVLGLMFRKDAKERNRQNLIVFITPSIVKDNDFQPAQSAFLKTTLQSSEDQEMKEDWSSWDSGKPHDWSKPKAPSANP